MRTLATACFAITILVTQAVRVEAAIPLWDEGLWAEKAGALYLGAAGEVGSSVSLRCYALSWSYDPAYEFATVRVSVARTNESAGLLRFSCEFPEIVIRINPHDPMYRTSEYASRR
jgi:hypothetical protein